MIIHEFNFFLGRRLQKRQLVPRHHRLHRRSTRSRRRLGRLCLQTDQPGRAGIERTSARATRQDDRNRQKRGSDLYWHLLVRTISEDPAAASRGPTVVRHPILDRAQVAQEILRHGIRVEAGHLRPGEVVSGV